ncbi:hypothetical protein [Ignatzschineria cameli]|uniref:O-antigen ligase domain-containing protein n=1 Tax=Ignatzschineria cameli TaxID=2182793 RepID=A0A2U2AQN6_9GAMM|nr:hypothetical protein [Ignatzschineria cameli]PWD86179.1 hypothetical protein DC077_05395 [Ignatzschineria cameli]
MLVKHKVKPCDALESFFFTVLTTFLLFNIKFKGLPPTFFISSAILTIMALYFIAKNGTISSRFLKLSFLYALFFITLMLSFAANAGNPDIHLIKMGGTIFFISIIVPYAYLAYFKNREVMILRYIALAGIINAIFLIGMFLSYSFKATYLSLLLSTDLTNLKGDIDLTSSLYSMRMIGLTGSATYGMAVTQVVLAFVYVYYVLTTAQRFTIKNSIVLGTILLSAVLSGRTAFVGIALLFIYLLLFLNFKDIIKNTLLLIVFLVVLFLTSQYFLPENFYSFFENWMLEFFTKGKDTGSLKANLAMYKYGWDDFSLLGDFRWSKSEIDKSYYMDTDVGWYRLLFAFGYLGSGFLIIYFVSLLGFQTRLNIKNITSLFIGIFLLVVLFKGAILFDFYICFFILVILQLSYSGKEYVSSSDRIYETSMSYKAS